MENRKCHDCSKKIEPGKELRFFELRLLEDEETYAPTEGYLCEVCADQRNVVVTNEGKIIKKTGLTR